jgi:hypothetical protein
MGQAFDTIQVQFQRFANVPAMEDGPLLHMLVLVQQNQQIIQRPLNLRLLRLGAAPASHQQNGQQSPPRDPLLYHVRVSLESSDRNSNSQARQWPHACFAFLVFCTSADPETIDHSYRRLQQPA